MKLILSDHSAILLVILTVCGGCSDGNPFEYVPVSGQLTYEDGSLIPAGGMRLQFEPLDAKPIDGMFPRPASTGLDAEGRFAEVTSYKFGDGLMPGRHKVAIAYATDKTGKLLVPQSCTHLSTTPLVADTAELPLKILVSKP